MILTTYAQIVNRWQCRRLSYIIHGTAEQRGQAIGNFAGDVLIGYGISAAFSKGTTAIDDVAKKADDVPLATNQIDDIIDIDAETNMKHLEELGQAEMDVKKIVDDIDNHIDNGINKVDDVATKADDVPVISNEADDIIKTSDEVIEGGVDALDFTYDAKKIGKQMAKRGWDD